MREILFRGKRVSDGQWVTGSYIRANMHWHEKGIHEDWISPAVFANGGYMNVAQRYAVKGDTVGQYTGLADKNGKKIFEGDIVRATIIEIGVSVRCETGVIRFGFGSYDLQIGTESGKPLVSDILDEIRISDVECELEVLGNIHDNPELIGGDC